MIGSVSEDDSRDRPAGRRGRGRLGSPRTRAIILAGVSLLVLVAVAVLLPVPYVKIGPGPTFNTIGDNDGRPLVEVGDSPEYPVYPVTGNLDMTTIMEWGGPRGGLTVFQAIASWLDPEDAVVPRELLYPDDVTGDDVRKRNAEMFSTSQSYAIAAALRHLGIPVTEWVVATAVIEGSPAAGKIQAGDRIVTFDGTVVTDARVVAEAVRSAPVGTTFTVGVERDGSETAMDVLVTSAANPDDPSIPYVGVQLGYFYRGPMPISFTLQDIGGPSAGLFFALAIVDKFSPDDLAAGRHIAGTGTIDPAGVVGPIGGIRQKLAGASASGAQLFLMPRAHCDEARGFIPEGLTVVPVDTLTGAVDAITGWRQGAPLPTCPS